MTDRFAKKVAGIPTLLQRCRSVVIYRRSELQLFQGFQPLLESVTLGVEHSMKFSQYRPWESVGECPNLRSLTLWTSEGNENWPEHLFQQLTQLDIQVRLQELSDTSYHRTILSITMRLRSLTLMISFGLPQPLIHKSLQSLVLVHTIQWITKGQELFEEIDCPELRRLEIQAECCDLLSLIHLRHTQKLSELCICCIPGDEYGTLGFSEAWSERIVEFLRSIGTVKHLKLRSWVEVVSGVVEKIEADPALCPNLVSLHVETTSPCFRSTRF